MLGKPTFVALILGWTILPPGLYAGPLERVPEDGSLQDAMNNVADGGVVEIAAGTYASPANGFRYRSTDKAFTVRAADGAAVVLDGQGQNPILDFIGRGHPSRVVFEDLTFRDGFSADRSRAGGVSLDAARVTFTRCEFLDNEFAVNEAGGGALRIVNGSDVAVRASRFENNSSKQRGGAIFLLDSSLEIEQTELIGNRVNRQGHGPVSVGGAIYILDSEALIHGSRFESNEAGFAGGAIYIFGNWPEEQKADPTSDLTIVNSTFLDNVAEPHPCCPVPALTDGGAIHVEADTELLIDYGRFYDNMAEWGGAIGDNRSPVEIYDSSFVGNRTLPGSLAAGGTFNLTSNDNPNDPTNFQNASLVLVDSFVQGDGDASETQNGGCLFVAGDISRLYGVNGVPQDGTKEDNRAPIRIHRTVFTDCVATRVSDVGRGGAVYVDLVDLLMENTLIVDSHAFGEGATGGGLLSFGESLIRLSGSTFAHNSAELRGGGLLISGGEVEIEDSWFLANDVSPGTSEPIQRSTGAGMTITPDLVAGRDITGEVRNSIFADNLGLQISDLDRVGGPYNKVTYNDNQFFSTVFNGKVYRNTAVGAGGHTPEDLNSLVVDHDGAAAVDKSDGGNASLGSSPTLGRAVVAPSRVVNAKTAGDPKPPVAVALSYVWNGDEARLNNTDLPEMTGFLQKKKKETQTLVVDGVDQVTKRIRRTSKPGVPARPSNLKATVQGSTRVQLKWRDNSHNEDVFQVFRKVPGGRFKKIATVPSGTRSYLDKTAKPDMTYLYSVRASNRLGKSNLSKRVTITTDP